MGGGGDQPKASIGNYKGVMLCNRPNEYGQQKRPERNGKEPFNSRVTHLEPVGWNPSAKLLPRQSKKKSKYKSSSLITNFFSASSFIICYCSASCNLFVFIINKLKIINLTNLFTLSQAIPTVSLCDTRSS